MQMALIFMGVVVLGVLGWGCCHEWPSMPSKTRLITLIFVHSERESCFILSPRNGCGVGGLSWGEERGEFGGWGFGFVDMQF